MTQSDMTIYGAPCPKCGAPPHGDRPCNEGVVERLLAGVPASPEATGEPTAEHELVTALWHQAMAFQAGQPNTLNQVRARLNARLSSLESDLASARSDTEKAEREAMQYGIAANDHNHQHAEDAKTIASLKKTLGRICEAAENKGNSPSYHREVMSRHRKEWPTLWRAIDSARSDSLKAKP